MELEASLEARTREGRPVHVKALVKVEGEGDFGSSVEKVVRGFVSKVSYADLFSPRVVDRLAGTIEKNIGKKVGEVVLSVRQRCPVCNHLVETTPETVVYACPRCGWVGDVNGRPKKVLFAKPSNYAAELEEVLRKYGGVIVEQELRLVPVFTVPARVKASFSGYRREVGGGEGGREGFFRAVVETREDERSYPVIARINTSVYGYQEVQAELEPRVGRPGFLVEMGRDDARKYAPHMLPSEISEEEAVALAKERLEQEYLEWAQSRVGIGGELSHFSFTVTAGRPVLFYYPLLFFRYMTGNGVFRGVMDAARGRILSMETPIGVATRAAGIVASIALALASGPVAFGLFHNPMASAVVWLVMTGAALGMAKESFKPYWKVGGQ